VARRVPGRRARRRALACAAVALAAGLLVAGVHRLAWFAAARARSIDFVFASRPVEPARATVVVGIDQASYRALLPRHGAMATWPRSLHARALDALRAAGARVVVYDLFLDAPRPEDPALAAAMRRAGNVVAPVEAQGPGPLAPAPGIAQEFDALARWPPGLREAAAAEGFTNVTTDRDTVVRSVPLVLRAGGEDVPAIALAAVARYLRRPAALDDAPAATTVFAAGRAIPVVPPGRMLLDFLGPPSAPGRPGPFPRVSFVDVVDGTFDREAVRDRIVLVGLTIRGLDEVATPTTAETRMWGVELLGHAIETILQERWLVPVAPAITFGLVLLLALLAGLAVAAVRPVPAALLVIGLLAGYLVGAIAAFDRGLVLDPVGPPLAALLATGAALAYRVIFEQAEQRLVRATMARYLSPAVTQWALRDPERLVLGGETRVMTVMFSDLRGFTTLSHRLPPETLVTLLNEYMTAMTEVVFRHDGVLDKYIGDAIMAFWGAPADQPDHAARACRTALDMVERLRELQLDWSRRDLPRLELGIGLNTGPMVVGNMGSRVRLAYTVLGDAVNVASRLEGLCKEYATRTVVGESTRQAAGEAFAFRFLDVVAVKGRAEPLAVHELVGPAGTLAPADRARLTRYQEGVAHYRARRWAEACTVFRALVAEAPDDGPAALYLRRSETLLAEPPPADWDGVFVARTK
jgi:adenylate cyclase